MSLGGIDLQAMLAAAYPSLRVTLTAQSSTEELLHALVTDDGGTWLELEVERDHLPRIGIVLPEAVLQDCIAEARTGDW